MKASEIPEINPGIVETVQLLNDHGFHTTSSGDGVTKLYGCDPGFPFVEMVTTPEKLIHDSRRLASLLRIYGIEVVPQHPDFPSIQATFDPADSSAHLLLMNVKDEHLTAPPKCWAIHELPSGETHAIPLNDGQQHELSELCWCKPKPDDLASPSETYWHQTIDCRELIEQAEMIKGSELASAPSPLPWPISASLGTRLASERSWRVNYGR